MRIEDENFYDDTDAEKWLSMLFSPGSSLGGARPKASVIDPSDQLWIAKFPSKNDNKDSGAWEFLVNQLAVEIGLDAAKGAVGMYSQKRHTFLSKRFDRTSNNSRLHFASAMCLLGYKDGQNYKDGTSYLELVELIEQYGSNAEQDIKELWRRIVFSVAISNTDDHLRNHGFLLNAHGWKLSPAFDINPTENGAGLSLNISEGGNSLEFELCLEAAEYFRWNEDDAIAFIDRTKKVVSTWKERATNLKIPNHEINMMESAFRMK